MTLDKYIFHFIFKKVCPFWGEGEAELMEHLSTYKG